MSGDSASGGNSRRLEPGIASSSSDPVLQRRAQLQRLASVGQRVGYLFLLGYYAWYLVGFHRYYETPELRIPRSEEAITLIALLVAGLFAGQTVRQARRLAEGSGVTVAPAGSGAETSAASEGGVTR